MLSATPRWPARRSRRTAGWWRSSSGTRWSACSACRRRTRMIRSGRCGRAADRGGRGGAGGDRRGAAAAAGRDQHRARRWCGWARTRASGERLLAGDAINTASRLQSVAPEMGVAVGARDVRGDAVVFEYEELEPAHAEGQGGAGAGVPREGCAGPVRHGSDSHARQSRSSAARSTWRSLKGVFDKTVASNSVQLVTVVGEPGLGKCRLVAELFAYIDARPELITWRQGRCLPYGEGITFWALGEILKAHTGILESDPPGRRRRRSSTRCCRRAEERAWFRQRLLPLLGIEAASAAEREELFTAWRRFLERVAEERADRAGVRGSALGRRGDARLPGAPGRPAPRACRCSSSARPGRSCTSAIPTTRARLRNANTINLAPLSQEETARLVSALLEATVLPAELQQPILERAGGNPLYAEEFVRLLKDRDLLVRKARAGSSGRGRRCRSRSRCRR